MNLCVMLLSKLINKKRSKFCFFLLEKQTRKKFIIAPYALLAFQGRVERALPYTFQPPTCRTLKIVFGKLFKFFRSYRNNFFVLLPRLFVPTHTYNKKARVQKVGYKMSVILFYLRYEMTNERSFNTESL